MVPAKCGQGQRQCFKVPPEYRRTAELAGGILSLSPYHEPGDLEDIWNPSKYMDDLVEVRNRLASGDFRVLYMLWLCAAMDDQFFSLDVPDGQFL